MADWNSSSSDSSDWDSDDTDDVLGIGILRSLNHSHSQGMLFNLCANRNPSKNRLNNVSSENETMGEGSLRTEKRVHKIDTLLNLAAQCAGRELTCAEVEEDSYNLDEMLLKKVAFHAFPDNEEEVRAFANLNNRSSEFSLANRYSDWELGSKILVDGRIKECYQVGFMLTAHVRRVADVKGLSPPLPGRDDSDIAVSLTFEQKKLITSSCSECRSELWCPHVIATVLHRIREADSVIYFAPMTETLATFDKEQLQKLLHYAVKENPSALLGKIFKFVGNVRDLNSNMNSTQGLPDPTFGRGDECITQWQLSLQKLEADLCKDLKEMTKRRSLYGGYFEMNRFYGDSFDLTVKTKDFELFNYVQRALDLVHENTLSAIQAVITIGGVIITHLERIPTTRSLNRFCHDVAHILAMFVLHPDTTQHTNELLPGIRELQRKSAKFAEKCLVEDSHWAELPSITSQFKEKLSEEEKEGLFIEPMCAAQASVWSNDFKDLVDGNVKPEESKYEEDIRLMLARVETMFHLQDPKKGFIKVGRLCARTIRVLARSALKDSILGAYLDQLGVNSAEAETVRAMLGFSDPDTSQEAPAEPGTSGTSGKSTVITPAVGKGKRKGKDKGKGPAPKRVRYSRSLTTEDFPSQLTQGEMAYSMMYLCQNLVDIQKQFRKEVISPRLLTGLCLLALELSRHRTTAKQTEISVEEQNWIYKVEIHIGEYLRKNEAETVRAVSLYMEALLEVGAHWYQGNYPLVMLDNMVYLWIKNDDLKKQRHDDMVNICANFLQDSSRPMEKFTLPSNSHMDIVIPNRFDSVDLYSKQHMDFAQKKFHVIAETFLSQVNTSKQDHVKLVIKVLDHFTRYSDCTLLQMITQNLLLVAAKLEYNSKLLDGMLRVVIHSVCTEQSEGRNWWHSNRSPLSRRDQISFIISLAVMLGPSSLQHIQSRWSDIFTNEELKRLLTSLKNRVDNSMDLKVLPKEVIDLVTEYFKNERSHPDDAMEMLDFFSVGDANYKKCIQLIINNYRSYTATALFELAKRIHVQGPKASGRNGHLNEQCFDVIEKALRSISAISIDCHPLTMANVKWMCDICTAKGSTSPYFKRMLKAVTENAEHNPTVILDVLQYLEKDQRFNNKTQTLTNSLLSSYRKMFQGRFRNCGHNAYSHVIAEMHQARLRCIIYHTTNGDERFDNEVVREIMQEHRTKKKLIRMLRSEFFKN